MKTLTKILLIGGSVLLLGAAGLFTACSREMGSAQGTHTADRKPGAKKYTCPMHPNYIADKPGECPVCGMNLVPVEETAPAAPSGHAGHGGGGADGQPAPAPAAPEGLAPVTVAPEQRQLLGITTAAAVQRRVAKSVRTAGKVAYDPDLYYAEQEYIGAVKGYEQARRSSEPLVAESARSLVDASRTRLRLLGLSDAQIEALAGRNEPDRSLLVGGGETMWVYAQVFEEDLPLVKSGQNVRVTVPAVTDQVLAGEIVAVDPVLDPQTRSAKARIRARNIGGILKPETYVNVEVAVPLGERLVVPSNAVIDTGSRQVVFVDRGNGVLDPREVRIGARTDGETVIESGIVEGEIVVTNANFLLDSESQLKATMQKATGGHQH